MVIFDKAWPSSHYASGVTLTYRHLEEKWHICSSVVDFMMAHGCLSVFPALGQSEQGFSASEPDNVGESRV